MSPVDDETFGQRVRRLRKDAGLTQSALSALVYRDKSGISRVETSARCTGELARALDVALGANGSLLELLPSVTVAVPTPYPEPVVMATIQVGEVTVSVPLDRRTLLGVMGSAGLAATAANSPSVGSPAPEATVQALRSELYRFTAMGRTASPDEVSALMIPQIAAIDAMRRSAPDRPRRQLLVLGSRYCEYLGWMRQEAGDIQGAWYWSDRASEWATAADWPDMSAYILARKANMAWYAGDWRQSVDLAGAAARAARTPGVRAQAMMQEARAYAQAAQPIGVERALYRSRALIPSWERHTEDDPLRSLGRFSVSTAGQVDHIEAWCWTQIGRSDDAIEVYERELDQMDAHVAKAIARSERLEPHGTDPGSWATYDATRRRAEYQAELAIAYARTGAPDRAVEVADEALSRMERVRSASVGHGLRQLVGALGHWQNRDDVHDITHRIRQLAA